MPDVKVENPNAFAQLGDVLKAMDGTDGKVGWFENSAYPDGTPVAYVAAIQELGSPQRNIPPRSFFRSTALEKDAKWRETANSISAKILTKQVTPAEGMELLCLQAEGDVAEKISTIQSPPLSQITLGVRKWKQMGRKVTGSTIGQIARLLKEGKLDVSGVSTKPLVDSAVMVNTLSSVVKS